MLLPGPEAQQLVTYTGWLLHGVRGGLAAGSLFILPGFLGLLGLSMAYVAWRDVTVVSGLLLGLKPAVVAIVASALLRLRVGALTSRGHLVVAAAASSASSSSGFPSRSSSLPPRFLARFAAAVSPPRRDNPPGPRSAPWPGPD